MLEEILSNKIVILLLFAFLPPLIYTVWIRNTERYKRQSWSSILLCFLWGATIAIVFSVILEGLFNISLSISVTNPDKLAFLTVVILAPLVEEFAKPLALRLKHVKKNLEELEDGLIYGAVAGLGFSATENLLYGVTFLSKGLFIFMVLMGIRSIGGCLLHASATALTGYGYGKTILKRTSFIRVLPYFILAVLLHASYNFLVSYELLGLLIGLVLAIMLVVFTMSMIRKVIRQLDATSR
ncbi:MAG: PrsW family intramembrane metalloprotease [Candidatus Thermoplasmatota archaeon]